MSKVEWMKESDAAGGSGDFGSDSPWVIHHSSFAFTLLETVLALALTSIVLLAITSAIVLAAQALPQGAAAATATGTLDGASAMARITGELRDAIHFSEFTGEAVTFSIPDRDQDGQPDRIRYHWSGKAGDPLYRSFNGGADAAVLDAVEALRFAADLTTETISYPGVDVKSSETLLHSYYVSSNQSDRDINYSQWCAQPIRPSLPGGALRWQITRAAFALKYDWPTDGVLSVPLHAADSVGRPTGSALASASVNESSLAWYAAWVQLNYASAPVMNVGEALTFVFSQSNGSNGAGEILHADSTSPTLTFDASSTAGAIWSDVAGETLLHYVYGCYWSTGPTRTLTRQRRHRLTLTVQPTTAAAPLHAACNLDNKPYVADRFWRLTFDEPNPTRTDVNADAAGDWRVRSGAGFDPTDVASGVWNCDQLIDTQPNDPFTAPTTIALRMKAATNNTVGPQFWINADWGASSSNAGLFGRLTGGSGGQVFALYQETSTGNQLLKQVAGLPQGFIEVLLVVSPAHDEAALFLNGVHQGTFALVFVNDSSDTPNVTLEEIAGGACFDEVMVVVGGSDG